MLRRVENYVPSIGERYETSEGPDFIHIAIIHYSLDTVRTTKIMSRADKNWANFRKQNTLKIKVFKKIIYKS